MNKRGCLIHGIILLMIFVIGAGPWVLTFGSGAVATANDCRLDESSPHPCIINGKDYGDTLYTFGLMGWIGILTCPVALILLGIYFVVVIVLWLIRRGKANKAPTKAK